MNKKKCMILALAVLPMLNSCSDWLDPKPLSFYSPENTYVDAAGLYAALTACERNMRHEFFGDGAPILTEMYLTDIAVHGKTDENGKIVIENLIPGEYYIKETKTIEGYKKYEQLIKVDAELNQEVTVTVNNSKEEQPKIETKTEKNKSVASKTVKKLPVTGM